MYFLLHVPKALLVFFPQLVRYCEFRETYKTLYEGVDLWGLSKVQEAYDGIVYDRPDYGRVSIFRFGK